MESKKINQLATAVSPSTSDLAIIGDPVTGVSKKITWLQVSTLIGTAANLQQVTDNGATTTNPIAIGGLTITGLSTGVLKSDSGVISSVPFGAANGVATLAGDGKVPSSQLPSYVDDVVEVANYAALPVTGETGKIYITLDNNKVYRWGGSVYIEVAANQAVWGSITGTLANQTDLQNALNAKVPTSRTITINGTSYDLSANRTWSVGTLTSVGLTMPSGFSVASSPLTGAGGTIAVTGAGASNQYIDGTGALQTFPTLLSSDNLVKLVRNQSGATMTAGTIVYISGATGNKPLIAKALATGDATSAQTYGLLQTDIANNADGYVVVVGNVGSLDTSALTEGQQLYLSGTTAGAYTTTKPYAPTHLVYVGIVLRSHPVSGIIGVKIQNGYEMDELHNVDAYAPSNNDILSYNTTTSLWEHKQIATTLGFTPISLASLSATSPLIYNNGTGAFSIQVATSTQNGYLASGDWSTFNNKQDALGGTGFVKITGSTISYDNSTYYLASNPSGFITLASLSAGAGISYSNITGVISSTITQYTDALARAAISSSATGLTYTSATGVFSLTAGYSIPTTAKQTTWDTAYNDSIISAAVSGTTTKTLTLTQQDAGTITASWTDINTDAVSSVFGRTGAVIAVSGDYNTDQVTEGVTNLYYTNSRARLALSFVAGSGAYNSTTGVITIPTNNTQITNGAGYITGNQTITLSGDVSGSGATAITTTIGALKVTNAMLAGSIDLTTKVTGLLPDANISSAATWNAKQAALNGTGFVKATGTTISYDNSTYLTTTSAASTYVPYTGATGAVSLGAYGITARTANITSTGGTDSVILYSDGVYGGGIGLNYGTNPNHMVLYYNGATALKINTSQNATFGGTATATALTATTGTGKIVLNGGDATHSGYINWYAGNGSSRLGYMGYNNTDIELTLEGTSTFKVTGGAAVFSSSLSVGTSITAQSGYFAQDVVGDPVYLRVRNLNTGGYSSAMALSLYGYSGTAAYYDVLTIRASYPAYGKVDFLVKGQSTSTSISALSIDATNGAAVFASSITANSAIFNNGSNSTNGIKVISTLSSSLYTGGIEFIRTSVAAGSKIEPFRDAAIGGVGLNFLVTTNNAAEVDATYTSAIKILNNGRVLIGTDSDVGYKLYVRGNFYVNNNAAGTLCNITDGIAQSFQINTTSTGFDITNPNAGYISFSNTSEKMRILPNGAIGIGNTNPQARLDLGGGYGASGEKFLIYNDNNSSALAGTKSGFYLDRFGLSNNTTYVFPTYAGYDGSFIIASKNTGDTTLVARFAVRGESGNVGIGQNNPITLLDLKRAHASGYGNFVTLINLNGHFPAYDVDAQRAGISAGCPNMGNTTYGMIGFETRGSDGYLNRMTINGTGNILVGHNSENSFGSARSIQINGAGGSLLETRYNGTSGVRIGSGSDHAYMHDPRNAEMRFATSDSTRFYIYGNGNYSFTGSNVSDRRAKDNISLLDITAIDKIMSLEAKTYNMKNNPSQKRYGFIAQEVKQIISDLVNGNENDGYLGLDYDGLLTLTIKALQEQQKEIQILKQK
jgi:hypothetical protein